METTFLFGINLLVAVPTTLRSVWFASYPSSKRLPAQKYLTDFKAKRENYKSNSITVIVFKKNSYPYAMFKPWTFQSRVILTLSTKEKMKLHNTLQNYD